MSEVGDAVQVVMLCGRSVMLIGNISLKLAMQIVKLLNTIYLAKWEGSVSLNRLRQIKGDDFVFINVSSEKKEDLAAIEKEMKSHGILYARMPDLCGGDARTQYAIASSDAVKMKAMLLDHTAGPNSHIRVGPISEADYMMTGKKADGTDTKEMETLKKSAQETIDAASKKAPKKTEAARQSNNQDKKILSGKTKSRQEPKPEKVKTAPEKGTVRAAAENMPSQQASVIDIPMQKPVRSDVSLEEKLLRNTISDVRIRSQE